MKYTIWTWKHPSIFLKYNILSEDVLHFHGNTGSIWMWGKESGETKEKKPQGGENLQAVGKTVLPLSLELFVVEKEPFQ